MYMTTLISITTSPFCHEWQRVSISSRHLIISIITAEAIITLILENRWNWRGSNNETTHDSLSSCDMTNMGVHLTQLITECVKVSIHAHKLCHNGLKSHSTRKRQRSKGGWSSKSWRSRRLCLGPPRSKLCLAPSNSSSVYGIHNREIRRFGKGNRKMVKKPRDRGRKKELITSRCIPIDIYKR